MSMPRVSITLLLAAVLLLMVSCGPDAAALEATVESGALAQAAATLDVWPPATAQPTYTPAATLTRQPTLTAVPTLTPAPTLTAQPSHTPRPTLTPYPTYTPSPTPSPAPTWAPAAASAAPQQTADLATALLDHIVNVRLALQRFMGTVPPRLVNSHQWEWSDTIKTYEANCPVAVSSWDAAMIPFARDVSAAAPEVQQAYQIYQAALANLSPAQHEYVARCRAGLAAGTVVEGGDQAQSAQLLNYREVDSQLRDAQILLGGE